LVQLALLVYKARLGLSALQGQQALVQLVQPEKLEQLDRLGQSEQLELELLAQQD
jgi:hypothetical protein